MSECPLCQATYSNDTSGDELFVLHLTNLHGMDDDNAQDILGRSMETDPFGKGNSFSSPNPAGYSDPSGEADYLDKHEKQKDGTVKTTRLDEWESKASEGYGRDGGYRTIGNFHSEWVEEQFKRDGSALYCKRCGKIFPEQEFSIRGANDHLENDHNLMDPAFESKASESNWWDEAGIEERKSNLDKWGKSHSYATYKWSQLPYDVILAVHSDSYSNAEALRNPIEEYIESISNEVDFQTMEDAEKWWDNKFVQYGSKPWADQNIAERRTTINAYLRRSQNGWGNESKQDQEWTELMRSVEGKIIEHDVWDEDTNKLIDPSILEDDKKTEGFTDKIEAGFNKLGVRLDRDPDQVESDEAIDLDDISHLNPDQCIKCGEDAYWHTPEGSVSWNSHQYVPKSSVSGEAAYGFSKSEWDAFSDDTKKSIQSQLGIDQPEINITEYGTGDESNALGNYKDKEIIDQMQSEESMCDSCLDKALEKLALEDDTSDGDMDWITMNGTHIPIRDGQDKKSAVDDFLDGKGKSSAPKTEPKTEPKKEEPKKEEPKTEIDWDTFKHDYNKPAGPDNPLSRDYGNNPYYDPAEWSILNGTKEKLASDITGLPKFIPNPNYDKDAVWDKAWDDPEKKNSDSLFKGQDGLSKHDNPNVDKPKYTLDLMSDYKPKLRSEAKAIIDRFPDGQFSYNTKGRGDIMEDLDYYYAEKARGHKHRSWEEAADLVSRGNMGDMPFHDLPLYLQKQMDKEYKQFVKEEISQSDGAFKSMADYKQQRDEGNARTLDHWYDKPPADA